MSDDIESLRRDAERYRLLRDTMLSAKGGATLAVNEQLSHYETPEPGKEVSLQWYPDTPVGFYVFEASTLDGVIDAIRERFKP